MEQPSKEECNLRGITVNRMSRDVNMRCSVCGVPALKLLQGDEGVWTVLKLTDLQPTTVDEFVLAYETIGGLLTMTSLITRGRSYKPGDPPKEHSVVFVYPANNGWIPVCWTCVNAQYQDFGKIIYE